MNVDTIGVFQRIRQFLKRNIGSRLDQIREEIDVSDQFTKLTNRSALRFRNHLTMLAMFCHIAHSCCGTHTKNTAC